MYLLSLYLHAMCLLLYFNFHFAFTFFHLEPLFFSFKNDCVVAQMFIVKKTLLEMSHRSVDEWFIDSHVLSHSLAAHLREPCYETILVLLIVDACFITKEYASHLT